MANAGHTSGRVDVPARFEEHLNRRGQDSDGRRRNIEDGLRAEQALTDLLTWHGIGFRCPLKPPPGAIAPDAGDCLVEAIGCEEVWSVKTSRMRLPVVCADQRRQAAARYVFYATDDRCDEPHGCYPLGIISHPAYYACARFVRAGDPINPTGARVFPAHYDLYVCDVEDLTPLLHVVERLARGEAA